MLPSLRQHCFGEVPSEAVGSKREASRAAAHPFSPFWRWTRAFASWLFANRPDHEWNRPLVGDPYQLSPIGFGLVFQILAASPNVPRVLDLTAFSCNQLAPRVPLSPAKIRRCRRAFRGAW